ncbi:unnamed protein product [Rhizophagus irregularis]|nr:unnamed protein product [Rhizophagus irregularis]
MWKFGNHDVDEFIQKAQLKASSDNKIIEWIEYDKFEDVEYLAKGGFGTVFKAVWKDGPWKINRSGQLEREGETKVALKCLHNSQDITAEFLKEVESHILVRTDCSWQVKEADEINKKASFPVQLPLSSTSMLSYITHPQAVYTSRLLDFKNLPQPKNANNDDLEYSVSLSVDFTKLDINSKDENN